MFCCKGVFSSIDDDSVIMLCLKNLFGKRIFHVRRCGAMLRG